MTASANATPGPDLPAPPVPPDAKGGSVSWTALGVLLLVLVVLLAAEYLAVETLSLRNLRQRLAVETGYASQAFWLMNPEDARRELEKIVRIEDLIEADLLHTDGRRFVHCPHPEFQDRVGDGLLGAMGLIHDQRVELPMTWRGETIGSFVAWRRNRLFYLHAYVALALLLALGVVGSHLALRTNLRLLDERRQRIADLAEQYRVFADEARAGTRAKDAFLANMSHEIRTPMTAVIGMADLLLGADLPAREHEQVATIARSAQALVTLIDDILDLARIEAGRLELRSEPFDPGQVIEDVRALLAGEAAAKGIGLVTRVDPALPARLEGDGTRLRQVLVNLVANAIKFTDAGRVELKVDCIQVGQSACLHVRVEDTGIGIPADQQERIFRKFNQADGTTTRRHGGVGLGLAICRHLVEMMDGQLSVASRPGEGSVFTFTVTLPVMPSAPGDSRGTTPPPDDPPGERRWDGTAVLLVEDNDINRMLLARILEDLGCAVTAADCGAAALDRLGEGRFDLVLLDLHMPGIDGVETAQRFREMEGDGPRTPVVAVTADALPAVRERCLAAGMDDFVVKPFRKVHIARLLERHLGN